jgi:hypothetical protein
MSRFYAPGDAYTRLIAVQDATGEAADADDLPTAALWRDDDDDDTEALTVTSKATGLYRVSGTIPEDWEAGESVSMVWDMTVGGVTIPPTPVHEFQLGAGTLADAVVAKEEFQRAFARLVTHGGTQTVDGDGVITEVLTAPNGGTLTVVTPRTRVAKTTAWEDPE